MSRERIESFLTSNIAKGDPGLRKIARFIDINDMYTWGHSERVCTYALALGRAAKLSDEDLERLRIAALLHDLGMLFCPKEILRKPTSLDMTEWFTVFKHPVTAAEIIGRVEGMADVARIVRHHHERWTGDGYPDKLTGEAIPVESRILSVVDAYDAMVSNRPFRSPLDTDAALMQLQQGAGTQFDPVIAKSFALFVEARCQRRAEELGAASMFAELSVRKYEKRVRWKLEENPRADQLALTRMLMAKYPELGDDKAARIVEVIVHPDAEDSFYSEDVEWTKDNEARVRHPARIDADVGSVLRFEGKVFTVVAVTDLDDGGFEYLIKR